MEYTEIFDDGNEFLLILTIDNSPYEEVEVQITDPYKTLRDQINNIVDAFELPKMNADGEPIIYRIAQMKEDGELPQILPEEVDGEEKTLVDHNIQSGDRLHLLQIPIAG